MEKRFNSGFRDTGLDAYLRGRGVQTIILAGLQTEYCIDATCKSAAEKGYTVLIPRAGTSTFDNGPFAAGDLIRFYENNIWNGRYARVLPLEEIVAAINGACAQKI